MPNGKFICTAVERTRSESGAAVTTATLEATDMPEGEPQDRISVVITTEDVARLFDLDAVFKFSFEPA